MKTKNLFALALSAAMITATAVSVSAANLTNQSQSGQTEVIARIDSSVPAGITYEIIIPDVVNFGTLEQPAQEEDSYKTVGYTVELNKVSGLAANQQVSVYVRDQNATVNGDQYFYIANKVNNSVKFKYNVFKVPEESVSTATSINANPMTSSIGYYLDGFTTEGETVEGTLVLNQLQLYGKSLPDIVGDYSGYMVFYSTIEEA